MPKVVRMPTPQERASEATSDLVTDMAVRFRQMFNEPHGLQDMLLGEHYEKLAALVAALGQLNSTIHTQSEGGQTCK